MSAQLEADRKEYESQLELVITSLRDDPDNSELHGLRSELEQMIQLLDDSLAELKPRDEPVKAPPKRAPSPPPAEPKWSRENHPAFKKAAPAPEEKEKEKEKEPEIIAYQVNDNVMAKWVTGDKGFYPARITAVTGSSTAPIYTVKFKSYDTVETLRAKDIRPVAQKRKADGTAVSGNSTAVGGTPASTATVTPSSIPPTPSANNNGIVLSAAADMYPQAQAANNAEANDDKPRPKFKKIKATKELEKGKNKWQEFTTKGKFGKAAKKESMFRTPEGVHGRVGFTGSGQSMRKDAARTRHVYQPNDDLD